MPKALWSIVVAVWDQNCVREGTQIVYYEIMTGGILLGATITVLSAKVAAFILGSDFDMPRNG